VRLEAAQIAQPSPSRSGRVAEHLPDFSVKKNEPGDFAHDRLVLGPDFVAEKSEAISATTSIIYQ
jgi:hypothetical protein